MKEPVNGKPDTSDEDKPDLVNKASGIIILLITVVVASMLIISGFKSYKDRLDTLGKHKGLSPGIVVMETRVDRATVDALKRLDPDYRKAESNRELGKMPPGDELLPIYDGTGEDGT